MDKLENYRNSVKTLLTRQAQHKPSHGKIESTAIFDDERNQYLLINYGWDASGRVHSVTLHLRIDDGKIWIEHDGLESGAADELVALGVADNDIVLGFLRPERRALVDLAVE